MSSVAERIAAGVAWLDDNYPGWDKEIDPWQLNMRSPDACVLGQLGRPEAGSRTYWTTGYLKITSEHDMSLDTVTSLGFGAVVDEWDELEREWAVLLIAREGARLANGS